MTGRNPAEFPSYPADFGLPDGLPTVTNLLRDQAGYRTGHVGKWHLGPEDMIEKFGDQYGIDTVKRIGPTHKDPMGRDSAVFRAALDFIDEARDDERPFYLNIWTHVAHSPVKPPQHLVDLFSDVKVDRSDFDAHMQHKFDEAEALGGDIDDGMKNYLADLYALDMQIGWILDKLDRLGLADNTVLAISADHGAAPVLEESQSHPTNMMGYAGGLRGGKHDFFEGGLREPFLIRWPGQIPAGATSDSVVWAMDWLPTVASMAGISIDGSRFDGEDVTDILTQESGRSRTNPLVWKFPHKNIDSKMVMLYDDWKLHMWKATGGKASHRMLLYNLKEDPGEDYDLHDERADIAHTLSKAIIEWESHLPKKYAIKRDSPIPFDLSANPYVAKPPYVLHDSVPEEEPAVATPEPTATPTIEPTPDPTPGPTDAPITLKPTHAPVSPLPTIAPVSPAPTDAPVTPAPTNAPVSPAPTTVAPSKIPTLSPQLDSVLASNTCAATGSSCGDADSLPCCSGDRCVYVHGLGRKCLWIQPVSPVPTNAPVGPAPTNAPVTPAPTNAPVSPAPTTVSPSRVPTLSPQSDSVLASNTCAATGSSCGDADSLPCCSGDRCVYVHGLGRKCLWIHPSSTTLSVPPTVAPTHSEPEEEAPNVWPMHFSSGGKSVQDAQKEIEAWLRANANANGGK